MASLGPTVHSRVHLLSWHAPQYNISPSCRPLDKGVVCHQGPMTEALKIGFDVSACNLSSSTRLQVWTQRGLQGMPSSFPGMQKVRGTESYILHKKHSLPPASWTIGITHVAWPLVAGLWWGCSTVSTPLTVFPSDYH